jgi:hypothetical protein
MNTLKIADCISNRSLRLSHDVNLHVRRLPALLSDYRPDGGDAERGLRLPKAISWVRHRATSRTKKLELSPPRIVL